MNQKNSQWTEAVKPFLKECGKYALILICVLYLVPHFIVQRTLIDGSSMENTFMHGDQILVEKVTKYIMEYDRFDIIVFEPKYKAAEGQYIKRIIGLPGETVQIIDGKIYINGEVLTEQFGKDPIVYAGVAAEPITVGPKEYFVLGDNREVSLDSRYEVVGLVSHSQIEGKALLQIYPFSEFGTVE